MQTCIGVRLDEGPKLFYFSLGNTQPPAADVPVVVRTQRGLELGKARTQVRPARAHGELVRIADATDLVRYNEQQDRSERLKWWLKARFRQAGIVAKLIGCGYTLDGEHFKIRYAAEERPDIRRLVGEITRKAGARVELVALGPRDQTAQLGTLGACGMESCCSSWMQSFVPTTIRMARDQQLPLSPEKISGPCGRLLCCLSYEHPHYKQLLADLPKRNARVCNSAGTCGKVIKLFPLNGTVDLLTPEGSIANVAAEDLKPAESPGASPRSSRPEQD